MLPMANIFSERLDAGNFINSIPEPRKIVDIGCGPFPNAWPQATHLIDYINHEGYDGLGFTIQDLNDPNLRLPFADNTFDFAICVQCIEHILDPARLMSEISRIAKSGYLEFPLPLEDNLLSGDGDQYGHKWWFKLGFDSKVIYMPRQRLLTIISSKQFRKVLTAGPLDVRAFFKESFHAGIIWKDSIDFCSLEHDYYVF